MVALLGALAVTAPRVGEGRLGTALDEVDWSLLVFLAATLALGDALITSGAATALADVAFAEAGDRLASPAAAVAVVVGISLLAHLVITSRTARATVLVPIVIALGAGLGHDPVALAFASTAAAGFCLTLTVSAKPVLMFSRLAGPTFSERDLLVLSAVLLPIHFGLLMGFALAVWPLLGLSL